MGGVIFRAPYCVIQVNLKFYVYIDVLFSYIYISAQNVTKIIVKYSGLSCPHEKEEINVNVRPQTFSC